MQTGSLTVPVVLLYLERMTSLGSHRAVPAAFSVARHGTITQTLHNF